MAGVVNTTYTFTATDLVTSSKINNLIDETVFTSDAITGTTLEVTGAGKLRVGTGGVTSNELGANSVTTVKIVDANVTTAKIADASVTSAKLTAYGPTWTSSEATIGNTASSNFSFYISPNRAGDGLSSIFFGSQTGTNNNAYISRGSGVNGALSIVNTGTGSLIFSLNGSSFLSISATTGYVVSVASMFAPAFNVTSDYRLKSHITPLDDQIDNIMALRPVSYDISGENRIGLIAHEVQDIFPEAVRGEKDAVKEDGTPAYQSIEYTALIPALIAVIQEQQRQIDELFASR